MNPMLIGALVGAGKNFLFDQPRENRQRQLAATQAAYSPWTGIQPGAIQEADLFGSSLQGATLGGLWDKMGGKLEDEMGDKGTTTVARSTQAAAGAKPNTASLGAQYMQQAPQAPMQNPMNPMPDLNLMTQPFHNYVQPLSNPYAKDYVTQPQVNQTMSAWGYF